MLEQPPRYHIDLGLGYRILSCAQFFQSWWIQRMVKDNITMYVNKEKGYNITMIQGTTTVSFKTDDSTTNNIFIKQTQ